MENLREKIREIIKEMIKLNETSVTGGGASFTPGKGAQHASKRAFKKKNSRKEENMYYKMGWKKVPKKIKGSGLEVKKLFN